MRKKALVLFLCSTMVANNLAFAALGQTVETTEKTVEIQNEQQLNELLESLNAEQADSKEKAEAILENALPAESENQPDQSLITELEQVSEESADVEESFDDLLEDGVLTDDISEASPADAELIDGLLFDDLTATKSNATMAEVESLRYDLYPDRERNITKEELGEKAAKVYGLFEDYIKDMSASGELKIKFAVDNGDMFTVAYDTEEESYDASEVSGQIELTNQEWRDAFQDAYDVFAKVGGDLLWFDHIVVMGDISENHHEDMGEWKLDYEIGIPTEVTFDEIIENLENLKDALASGFTIVNGVLTAYTGTDIDIVIPSTVREIGEYVFQYKSFISSVTIPESVLKIGHGSFYKCSNLQQVAMVSGIESIGSNAFSQCSRLSIVAIPSSVTEILYGAFRDCTGLSVIDFTSATALEDIGDNAFRGCTRLTSIAIPIAVSSIGQYAFYGCRNLKKIGFDQEGSIVIESSAFEECDSLTELVLSVNTTIQNRAFYSCDSLISVTLNQGITLIPDSSFAECKSLSNVVIPDGVTEIGSYAFYADEFLSSISIPSTVTEINDNAFNKCIRLNKIEFKVGLNIIGSGAFSNCDTLTDITLPNTVYTISSYAFAYCDLLNKIVIPESVTAFGKNIFDGITENVTIYGYPDSGAQYYASVNKMNFQIIGGISVDDFIQNYYTKLLERKADNSELSKWRTRLTSGDWSGASMAYTIVHTEEFMQRMLNNDEYIQVLYEALLESGVSVETKNILKNKLDNGVSRDYILKTLIDLDEFKQRCSKNKVEPGDMVLVQNRDKNYQVTSYVSRCYKVILGRSGDENGLNNWTGKLLDKTAGGGNIVAQFLCSKEYINRNKSREETVTICYQAMLNRNPDASGKTNRVQIMNSGVSNAYLAKGFCNSTEFKNLCSTYGITNGSIVLTENRDQNIKVTQYVSRCYKVILGRSGDENGLNNWTGKLLDKIVGGGNIVAQFLCSKEYINRNKSREETVTICYQAMLNRNPDASGKTNWVQIMNSGVSNAYLAKGFCNSTEFKNLCSTYGITNGSIVLTENRDQNIKVTQFVTRNYEQALGRSGDVAGINSWAGKLLKKTQTPKQVANSFVFSKEATNKNLNDQEFVKMLYRLYMGRGADTNGLNTWVGRLGSGWTRQKVSDSFARSKEFTAIVASYGL